MSHKINITVTIPNENKVEELMTEAISEITKNRINKLPEQLRLKVYERLIEATKLKMSTDN